MYILFENIITFGTWLIVVIFLLFFLAASGKARIKQENQRNKKTNDIVLRKFDLQVKMLQEKIVRGAILGDGNMYEPWELESQLTQYEFKENSEYMRQKWDETLKLSPFEAKTQ